MAADHRGAGASLLEREVREVCCCLGVEEEARRSLIEILLRSFSVGEGEVRASLVEH